MDKKTENARTNSPPPPLGAGVRQCFSTKQVFGNYLKKNENFTWSSNKCLCFGFVHAVLFSCHLRIDGQPVWNICTRGNEWQTMHETKYRIPDQTKNKTRTEKKMRMTSEWVAAQFRWTYSWSWATCSTWAHKRLTHVKQTVHWMN